MAASIRSRSAIGVAALAATAIALPAVTPSMPAASATHTFAVASDAPAREFAVRLLSSLEQTPAAAVAAKNPVSAAAVPAGAVTDIFPAIGYGIAGTYMAGLNVVNAGLDAAYGLVSAIPLVNVLAPQIYLLTNPIKQVINSAVLNVSLTVALMRDPISAVFSVISSAVSAAVGFVVNEASWALNIPGALLGLAAMPAAATKAAKSAAAAPTATALNAAAPEATTDNDAATPEKSRKARADKRHTDNRHQAKADSTKTPDNTKIPDNTTATDQTVGADTKRDRGAAKDHGRSTKADQHGTHGPGGGHKNAGKNRGSKA